MRRSNLKISLNEEIFNHDDGNCPKVFLYDEEGKFKGINEVPFSQAAMALLSKIRPPKGDTNE